MQTPTVEHLYLEVLAWSWIPQRQVSVVQV